MSDDLDRAIGVDNVSSRITTLSGRKISRLALASQYLKEVECVQAAFTSGINYFFSYNLSSDLLADGLKPLLTTHREAVFIATGSESRHPNALQSYFDRVRALLHVDGIDAFFTEYVSPKDSFKDIAAIQSQLQQWKTQGWIRYVGASTHNRDVALQLIEQGGWDVLMLRYNMAHRKAEEQILPMAQAAALPIIAFTCTRWGSLLKGDPQWHELLPTAADCYRYALHHPAVQVALTAPATLHQLRENLSVLHASALLPREIEHWQNYGNLIYGSGQDTFETQWL